MQEKVYNFAQCVAHCGFNNLPDGLEQYFELYDETYQNEIMDKNFLEDILLKFKVPIHKKEEMEKALAEIEEDKILCYFSKFLVWDMCRAKKRYEDNFYNNLVPTCIHNYSDYYSFILLLSCVKPSMQQLNEKGIPLEFYENIPYVPMKKQIEKWVQQDDITVSDFPWDMNFYTCSIFLMDRFYFIPCKFEDEVSVYRNSNNKGTIALYHADIEFRRDGQVNGTNEVYDEEGKFLSQWAEDDLTIRANVINPMGYVEKTPVLLLKTDWKPVVKKGDLLLAFHIPEGPGYTPERVKNSMALALHFYSTYFSELDIKGFWSESWVYDSRLSLIMDYEKSNIVKVQRQFYLYPTKNSDAMLLERVFGVNKIGLLKVTGKSSLQKGVIQYMKTGKRFNALNMFVLKEDVSKIGDCPYISVSDIDKFRKIAENYGK